MNCSGGVPYLEPCAPILFVEELTESAIRLLMYKLVKDPALLKIYGSNL